MRLNQFLALATTLSRRAADSAITDGRVSVNDSPAEVGQQIDPKSDVVTLDGKPVQIGETMTIAFNKPIGVVTSRQGQGSRTIYDLLPADYQSLNPVGRLDKDSSGLLLLTNDGRLANNLIHPSQNKTKRYKVQLDRPISQSDLERLISGVELDEGLSTMKVIDHQGAKVTLDLVTGWNRQIRRTFAALGYKVRRLHRLCIGKIELGELASGQPRPLTNEEAEWLKSS